MINLKKIIPLAFNLSLNIDLKIFNMKGIKNKIDKINLASKIFKEN